MLKSQQYADMVFKKVSALAQEDGERPKRYKSLCKRSGGIFRTVGLVQFATFLEAKGRKEPHYADLARHLREELHEINLLRSEDSTDYLAQIRRLPLPAYMHVSRTVLHLLQWHKRLGEILIEGIPEDDGAED